MRQIQILLLLIIFLNSCSGQDYFIETMHFDCLVKTSEELGVDLKQELSDFEEHLIKNGVLSNNSGESYYQIYETIAKTGDINFKFQYSLLDSIKTHVDNFELNDINTDCVELSEKLQKSEKFKNSKLTQLQMAMDSIQAIKDISVSVLASVILRILSPEDFEHDYYRMSALLLLATSQDEDSGIIKQLTPISKDNQTETIDKRNLLVVYISTDNDSVMLNERIIWIDDLSDIVKKYILNDSKDSIMPELIPININLIGECYQSKLSISISNEKETSYNTYVQVQDQLIDAYNNARDEKAFEYFNLEFDKLSSEQKNAIKKLIPMRISEEEPTN